MPRKETNKKSRRTNGDGTLYQRKDGTWCGQVVVGLKDNGKPERKTVYGKVKSEVAARVRELARSVDVNGIMKVSSRKDTNFESLCRAWFDLHVAPDYEDATLEHRRAMLRNHIFPAFGSMDVKNITTDHLKRYFNDKRTIDVKGREGYSWDFILKMKCMLNNFFIHAVERKYIPVNPMAGVKLPKRKGSDLSEKSGKALRPEVCEIVLGHILSDSIMKPIIITFMMTGLRPQELLALRWENVSIEQRSIKIAEAVKRTRQFDSDWNLVAKGSKVGATKSTYSVRTLPMPETVAEALAEWVHYCNEHNIYSEYVFPNTKTGGMRKYSGLRTSLVRFVKRHGLEDEGINLYSFRHTFATVLLNRRENPRLVADLMGHADASTLLKFYAAAFKEMHVEAAKALDDTFNSFTQKKNPPIAI